jgi:hypothetical protein
MSLSFLLIGISWDHFPGDKDTENTIRGLLDKGERDFKDAGYDYRFLEYSPDEDMTRLQDVLKGKRWDGVAM